MSLYIDTSCLLKLLVIEPESAAIRQAVAAADAVVVSDLARLEAEVTLHGSVLGGRIRARQYESYRAKLADLIALAPFRAGALSGSVFQIALEQARRADEIHCRSLDRLHLAAMQDLRLTRLMTNDVAQARAARALGYRVESPGRRLAKGP